MDVRYLDAYEVRKRHPHARLNGFESKPYAIQWSRFAEVPYLDADNVPVRDPTFLFDTPQYAQCGTVFWPDYHRLSRDRAAWRVFGNIPYRDEPEVESGQIVIDKRRCWRAPTFANWCGERSAFFFQHYRSTKVAASIFSGSPASLPIPPTIQPEMARECGARELDSRFYSPARHSLATSLSRS